MKRIKDYCNGYCIVERKHWIQYEKNAFVEDFVYDWREAEYMRTSYERCYALDFVVVEV